MNSALEGRETVGEKHLRGLVPCSAFWKTFECPNQTAYLNDDLVIVIGHRHGKVCGFVRKYLERNRLFQQTNLSFKECVEILNSENPHFIVTARTITRSDNLFKSLNESNP